MVDNREPMKGLIETFIDQNRFFCPLSFLLDGCGDGGILFTTCGDAGKYVGVKIPTGSGVMPLTTTPTVGT